jgi:protein ImuB
LIDGQEAGESLAALTDRLGVRLGRDRIRRPAFGNSHVPECAGFSVPVSSPVLPFAGPEREEGEPPLRPLHLFDPPQRVETIAEVPDGPPRRFRWRRVTHDVVASEGPERIAAEWWKRRDMQGLTRDYYRVEDSAGRRFWLFRHGLYGAEKPNPDWYLHGVFA